MPSFGPGTTILPPLLYTVGKYKMYSQALHLSNSEAPVSSLDLTMQILQEVGTHTIYARNIEIVVNRVCLYLKYPFTCTYAMFG
jgi:hypothetical protein